jgi:apolipoprotein D and lipocalin family protein
MSLGLLAMLSVQSELMAQTNATVRAPNDEISALKPIPRLDLERYLGLWYEISKLPNRFQVQCVSSTTAEYALNSQGSLNVLNRCLKANGQWDQALGQAHQVGDPQSPKLKVRFAPEWLSFLPMVWGDYWIIDLDERYELAAVSEPQREYLWILSRQPRVPQAAYEALIERLKAKGLAVDRLEKTPQEP